MFIGANRTVIAVWYRAPDVPHVAVLEREIYSYCASHAPAKVGFLALSRFTEHVDPAAMGAVASALRRISERIVCVATAQTPRGIWSRLVLAAEQSVYAAFAWSLGCPARAFLDTAEAASWVEGVVGSPPGELGAVLAELSG